MTEKNRKSIDSLVNILQQDLTFSPNSAVAYIIQGCNKYMSYEYKAAINSLNEAIRLDPNLAMAYCTLGAIRIALADYKGAINDFDRAIRLYPTAAAYFGRGYAKNKLELKSAINDYKKASTTILAKENILNKRLLIKTLISSEEAGFETAYALCEKKASLHIIKKIAGFEKPVLAAMDEQEAFLLSKCLKFGDNCEIHAQSENGKTKVIASYRLSESKGRRIFGEIKPMLRDNKGNIIAIPKLAEDGGRTCWLPDLGIELKGIGTINGRPAGNYGIRNEGEEPDPIGGMIKDKALYEHFAGVYLYIAGVDVPEPLGVAMPYNICGPKGKTLAVLARKPKTWLRWDDMLKIPQEVQKAVAKNLMKMHALGLVHYWSNSDNFNLEGQILDLEGVRVAQECYSIMSEEKALVADLLNSSVLGEYGHIDNWFCNSRNINLKGEEIAVLINMMGYYDSMPLALRVMPEEITSAFAAVFTDGVIPLEQAILTMRDERNVFGEYAKMRLDHIDAGVRERARQLYGRYENDVKETMKVASIFQKEIDYVKKNYL